MKEPDRQPLIDWSTSILQRRYLAEEWTWDSNDNEWRHESGLSADLPLITKREDYTPADAFGLLRSYSRHRDYVRLALLKVIHELERRSIEHDASKMLDDEFAGFARINAIARGKKFGSPEYKASMETERATIDLHFSRNPHHAECAGMNLVGSEIQEYELGMRGMSFLDVIEMVCDWYGARKGYSDNRMTWAESVAMNLESKGKYLTPEQRWLVGEVAGWME